MADEQGAKQKHEVYQCWVCSSNVTDGTSGIGCEKCSVWAHARCVNVTDKFIEDINKGKRISIVAYCDSCTSDDKYQKEMMKEIMAIKHKLDTQDGAIQRHLDTQNVIHKLTGNIDNLEREMKLMTVELKQIKDENKELKKICSELWDENNARGKMPATNAQASSYANATKNALIVKTADSGYITEKRAKIAKALADVPIDKTRETTNGAVIMNFTDKANLVKAKKAIDDADNIETTTKIGNAYAPRIMLTYVSLTNEDDDDDENSRDRFKMRIIDGLKRKNECPKNGIQNEDDLRIIQVRKTSKNKKTTKTCDPKV